ncbi:MAG: aminopeptidase, partial [Phototrophicales bacterium]
RYYKEGDVYIRVGGGTNTRAMSNIPPKRLQQVMAKRREWLDIRLERSAKGEFKWVGTWYPNEASAQEANMSLEEYAAFVYGATFCDREDPVAAWRELSAMQQQKVDWLKGKKQVVLKGPNIDLSLS